MSLLILEVFSFLVEELNKLGDEVEIMSRSQISHFTLLFLELYVDMLNRVVNKDHCVDNSIAMTSWKSQVAICHGNTVRCRETRLIQIDRLGKLESDLI